jgi:sugar-specific transcriptional regulator TrmB
LELLKKGQLSANQVAKNLGIDRTLTYTILNHLIEKGQVNYMVKENKKFFSCAASENLLNPIKTTEIVVLNLIKELKTLKKEEQQQTEINVYEGKEGLRVMNKLAIKEKEFCSFGSTGRAYFKLYEIPHLVKEITKKKIKIRIIGSRRLKGTEAFKVKGFEYKYVNVESEATTSTFGDYISIILVKEKPLIIIIKNKDIAQSYRNYFEYLWKTAKK